MKLLTVCIPTYKRPETLRRCIESVSEQTEKYGLIHAINIYVANDASPDNTVDVLSEFKSLDYFEAISRKNNLGMNVNIKVKGNSIVVVKPGEGISEKYTKTGLPKEQVDKVKIKEISTVAVKPSKRISDKYTKTD